MEIGPSAVLKSQVQLSLETCSLEKGTQESDAATDLGTDDRGSSDNEQEFAIEDTIIFIDWDDTVLPTSWLSKNGLLQGTAAASAEQRSQLQILAEKVAEVLEASTGYGKVVIVTNAVDGWVQQSCRRFLPSLAPVLPLLHVVSARSAFAPLGVQCPTEMKRLVFEEEAEGFASMLPEGAHLKLISMGDSVHEHDALIQTAKNIPGCYAKSLKLAPQPCIEKLMEQFELLAGALDEVVQCKEDLDIDAGVQA